MWGMSLNLWMLVTRTIEIGLSMSTTWHRNHLPLVVFCLCRQVKLAEGTKRLFLVTWWPNPQPQAWEATMFTRRRPRPSGWSDGRETQVQGCPNLRVLSLRSTEMGQKGAFSVLNGLSRGACPDLRDLGLAGNIIGTNSIKTCEEVTRIRPLLRIIATRGDRVMSVSVVLSFVLFWPFITTLAAICGRVMREAAEEHGVVSSLQHLPATWAAEVYHSLDDIQRVNIVKPLRFSSERQTSAIELVPSYLSVVTDRPLQPPFMQDYLDKGGPLRLATACHHLREYVQHAQEFDHEPHDSLYSQLSSFVPPVLDWWPGFLSLCLAEEVPLGDHGVRILTHAVREGRLPHLRRLVLQGQTLTPQGALHLALAIQDGGLGELRTLDLSGNAALGLIGVSAVLHAVARQPSLCLHNVHLDHSNSGILATEAVIQAVTGRGVQKHCATEGGNGLKSLTLAEGPTFRAPVGRLLRSGARLVAWFRDGGCRELRTLKLSGNNLGDHFVEQLIHALRDGGCRSLVTLDLGRNFVGRGGALAIAEALSPTGPLASLETLLLPHNRLSSVGVKAILYRALRRTGGANLRVLDLSYNMVRLRDYLSCKYSAAVSLIPGPLPRAAKDGDPNGTCASPNLRILRLRGNVLSPCVLQRLERLVSAPDSALSSLSELDLRNCGLRDNSLDALLGPLEYNLPPNKAAHPAGPTTQAAKTVRPWVGNRLSLALASLGSDSEEATAATSGSALRVLRLGGNGFSTGALRSFLSSLPMCPSLSLLERLDVGFASPPSSFGLWDLTPLLPDSTMEYLRGNGNARPSADEQIEAAVAAVACGCRSLLRFLDLRDGPLRGRARLLRADVVVRQDGPNVTFPGALCPTHCLTRLQVGVSDH